MSDNVPATPIPAAAPGGPTPSLVRPDTGRGGISRSPLSFPLPGSPQPGGRMPDTTRRHIYSGYRGHRSGPESYCKSFRPVDSLTGFHATARCISAEFRSCACVRPWPKLSALPAQCSCCCYFPTNGTLPSRKPVIRQICMISATRFSPWLRR